MGGQGSGGKPKKVVTYVPDRAIWDRQPKESDVAWRAFTVYRDMDDGRTMKRCPPILGKRPAYVQTIEGWSSRFGWVHRVFEWDREQDRIKREAKLATIEQEAQSMVTRHTQTSTLLQRLATVELQRWLNKVEANVAQPDLKKSPALSTKQLKGLLEYGINLERLNRGEPSAIIENRNEHSVADDRRMMRKLLTPESMDEVTKLLDLMDEED